MLGPVVLPHTLGNGILLTTVWIFHLTTLNTGRSVPPPHFLTSQHLTTLATWVLLPQCTPMCTINLWCVIKDCWHTGQSMASLGTPGTWYGTLATSLTWEPPGRSSPWRRADTCCLTHFKALFFTTTSSSAGQGSTGTAAGTYAWTAAGPLDPCLATPGMVARPSASSLLNNPISVILCIRRMILLPGWDHQLWTLQHWLKKILIGQDWNEKWVHTLDYKSNGKNCHLTNTSTV